MTEGILALGSHVRRRLIEALDAGILAPPYSEDSLRAATGLRRDGQPVVDSLTRLADLGVKGRGVAAWIRGLDEVAGRTPKPDLVWSGPEVPGVYARDTRRVFEELIGSAERSLWVCTYAYYDGPRAFEFLARRIDAMPGLKVTLLLNIQRKHGVTTAGSELVRSFAERFWEVDWPGTGRPEVYYDPRSVDLDGPGGVLHAKAVVADDSAVFVTSANLTEAALDRNFELGLLVRDGALALSVTSHFRELIAQRLLVGLPG